MSNTDDIQRLLNGEIWIDTFPLTGAPERTWVDGEDELAILDVFAAATARGARVVMMDVTGSTPVHPLNAAEAIWIGDEADDLFEHLKAKAIALMARR